MKNIFKVIFVFFLLNIIFSYYGCTLLKANGINVDGIFIKQNNFISSDEEIKKEISPIVQAVKSNLGSALKICEVSMNAPGNNIRFSLCNKYPNSFSISEMIKQLQIIHDEVNKYIYNNSENNNIIMNDVYYHLCLNNSELKEQKLLTLQSGMNIETGRFFSQLSLYDERTLDFISKFDCNFNDLYNKTGKSLPDFWYNNFKNLFSLDTYIHTNTDLVSISNLPNLQYANLIIKDEIDLSNLKNYVSIKNIDLYDFANIDLSKFPVLDKLEVLHIHSNNPDTTDISILKNKLPNVKIILTDDMTIR